jgi:phage N-6-adenine-methyltransferase
MEKQMSENIRDTWMTPENFRDAVRAAFGTPAFDTCASAENFFSFRHDYYTAEQDGLSRGWHQGLLFNWCNPPGSEVREWVLKADREARQGNSSLVLVQQGLESDWYHSVKDHCETLLLAPRVQFVPPIGIPKSSNPRNYMLLVFEPWMQRIPAERVRTWRWKETT